MRLTSALLAAAFLAATAASAAAQDSADLRPGITTGDDGAEVVDETAIETVDETITASVPRRTAPETDPYEALGIRAGGFILYPSLTVETGYTTNADAAAGGTGASFGTLTPELLLKSDWARHEATVTLRGSYEQFFDGSAGSPSGSVDATGRIDFADGWTGDLAGGYSYEQQSTSDPDFPAGVDSSPGVHELTASAGLTGHAAGRSVFTIEGKVDRSMYDDATSGGVPVDQGDRTNTLFSARLRAGYEVTPSLTPFAEGEVSRRVYDRPVDNDGLQRSSTGLAYRAGVALDRDPLLTGEIAVGYAQEDFDDPSLAPLSALTVDGSLVWAPTALTTVTFDGTTSLKPSADPASSGSVAHEGSVELAYAWRRNVTLSGTGAVRQERFEGTGLVDTGYSAGARATWKMNRSMHLTAGYLHEWLASSDPTRDYQSDTVRLELKMQR